MAQVEDTAQRLAESMHTGAHRLKFMVQKLLWLLSPLQDPGDRNWWIHLGAASTGNQSDNSSFVSEDIFYIVQQADETKQVTVSETWTYVKEPQKV